MNGHYGEVIKMLNYEYDAEAEKRVLREEAWREGRAEGKAEGKAEAAALIAELIRKGHGLDEALKMVGQGADG